MQQRLFNFLLPISTISSEKELMLKVKALSLNTYHNSDGREVIVLREIFYKEIEH